MRALKATAARVTIQSAFCVLASSLTTQYVPITHNPVLLKEAAELSEKLAQINKRLDEEKQAHDQIQADKLLPHHVLVKAFSTNFSTRDCASTAKTEKGMRICNNLHFYQ